MPDEEKKLSYMPKHPRNPAPIPWGHNFWKAGLMEENAFDTASDIDGKCPVCMGTSRTCLACHGVKDESSTP